MIRYHDLYDPQKDFVDRVYSSWRKGEPVVAQCGQRSGKNVMAAAIASSWPSPFIIGISQTVDASHKTFKQFNPPTIANESPKTAMHVHPGNPDTLHLVYDGYLCRETLVIIDEAFWAEGTEAVFDEFANYTPYILCLGSKGPYRWRNRKRIWRYATWDLNPMLPRDSEIIKHAYKDDPARADRDFGKQEP
jgi:hypothetical protein